MAWFVQLNESNARTLTESFLRLPGRVFLNYRSFTRPDEPGKLCEWYRTDRCNSRAQCCQGDEDCVRYSFSTCRPYIIFNERLLAHYLPILSIFKRFYFISSSLVSRNYFASILSGKAWCYSTTGLSHLLWQLHLFFSFNL